MIDGTRQRLRRGTAATLSWQPEDADGEPVDPGVVTATVTASDGTIIKTAGTATTGTGSDPRGVVLTAVENANLDVLTVTWKNAAAVTLEVTRHDIVGGFYFSSNDIRTIESSTGDPAKDPNEALFRARAEIETMIESVCSLAFVPRFDIHRCYTRSGVVVLPRPYVRSVRFVWIWSSVYDDASVTVLDSSQFSTVQNDEGIVVLAGYEDGCVVDIGYEHGLDRPPFDLRRAVLSAARRWNNMARSGVPAGAVSMTLPDGGNVVLATPGTRQWHTGIPEVDEVLMRLNHTTPTVL